MPVKTRVPRRLFFGSFSQRLSREERIDQQGTMPKKTGQKRDLYRTIYKHKKKMKG